jgi:hypothetical protein
MVRGTRPQMCNCTSGNLEIPGSFVSLAPRNDVTMADEKPYRPNVGIALFDASGLVLIGRRFRDDGP